MQTGREGNVVGIRLQEEASKEAMKHVREDIPPRIVDGKEVEQPVG